MPSQIFCCLAFHTAREHDGIQCDLHLIVHTTEKGYVDGTGLSVRQLAAALQKEAHGLRRYIILDCCFSGAALHHFSSGAEGVAALVAADIKREASAVADPTETLAQVAAGAGGPERFPLPSAAGPQDVRPSARQLPEAGTVLLCSSNADELSLTKAGDGCTLFTGSVLRVLAPRGASDAAQVDNRDASGPISFARLRDRVWGLISSKIADAPYPQLYAPRQVAGADLCAVPLLPLLPQAGEINPIAAALSLTADPEPTVAVAPRPPRTMSRRNVSASRLRRSGSHDVEQVPSEIARDSTEEQVPASRRSEVSGWPTHPAQASEFSSRAKFEISLELDLHNSRLLVHYNHSGNFLKEVHHFDVKDVMRAAAPFAILMRNGIKEIDDLKTLGHSLAEAIFLENIKSRFDAILYDARKANSKLESKSYSLWSAAFTPYSWECLFYRSDGVPRGSQFLSIWGL